MSEVLGVDQVGYHASNSGVSGPGEISEAISDSLQSIASLGIHSDTLIKLHHRE